MHFQYYNANPKLNNIEDCAARAVSKALGISWREAFTILSNYARKNGLMMNSVENVENFLDDNFERACIEDMTVGEFADIHNRGVYLITMPSHISVIVDGVLYDTFDCSDKFMWCSWKVL